MMPYAQRIPDWAIETMAWLLSGLAGAGIWWLVTGWSK